MGFIRADSHHKIMTDTLNPKDRSQRMSLIRGADTTPELIVRRAVHSMGFRYRLHVKALPGTPDLVFASRRKVILVHGCFWHRHKKQDCKLARLPKSRLDFWVNKLEGNRLRDVRNKRLLRRTGWSVLEVWECELQNLETLKRRLRYFLENEIT
jgi:DNA mismatch endonuclease (patch repair protein)